MKKLYYTVVALSGVFGLLNAYASDLTPYANTVSAHAIAGIQNTIFNRTIGEVNTNVTNRTRSDETDHYGTMLYYGEFGDDTGILPMLGHGGGDVPMPASIGFEWSHFGDDIKFNGGANMDANSDVALVSFAPYSEQIGIEFFGGYAGYDAKNASLAVDGDGGFIGARLGFSQDSFDFGILANVGIVANKSDSGYITRAFENIWVAGAIGAGYTFKTEHNIALRPGIVTGYTLINAPDYLSTGGDNIGIRDFGIFSINPMLDITKQLNQDWSMGLHAAYMMNFTTGGETYVNYAEIPEWDTRDYIEYELSVARAIDEFNLAAHIGRHDIGRRGWHGGIKIDYMF